MTARLSDRIIEFTHCQTISNVASEMAQTIDRAIQRPLYIFDLPQELLYTLQLKLQNTAASSEESIPALEAKHNGEQDKTDGSVTSNTSCALCGQSFHNVQEQRIHVRSDLHGYNLKQKLRGGKPVTEVEFERLVEDLDESISGSDSDTSDEEEGELNGAKTKEDTLQALLKRQAKITDGQAEDAPTKKRKRERGTPPMLWFSTPKLPSNTSLGIYRAVFTTEEQRQEGHLVETLQRKQLNATSATVRAKPEQPEDEGEGGVRLPPSMVPLKNTNAGPHYFLCMIGGGHFAAMLVSLAPKLTKKNGVDDRSAAVIAHKTFHRYTTRRKQGGAQSSNDMAKGNAHSAGAGIRRYNEVALEHEIRELLSSWKELVNSAELLFIRASGTTNRRTLFGPYEGQVLNTRDERLRGFPFNTRRATQSELMRAFVELTRVKVSTVDEAALAKQAEEEAAATARAEALAHGKTASPKPAKPSKADEEAALQTTQLQALIRRSKAPALLSYIESNKLEPNFSFYPVEQNHHAPTPLHLAAALNSAACVSSLLVKAGADPTVKTGDGNTAFDLAGDRPTRDAFRLARSQLGEQRWSWDAANVPSALSQAEVDSRTAREKEDKAAEDSAEKARRAAEMERLRKEDAKKIDGQREKKFGKGNVLAAPKMSAEERRAEESRGMSEEMKLKLEREKRARAAEERMKRLQGS